MTIREAIDRIDALKPNTYTKHEKISWLSQLDWTIKREILDTHAGPNVRYRGYTADSDGDTVLLAGPPYEDMYVRYMEAMIDSYNGDTAKYNNAITLFNAMYEQFRNDYNRHHTPLPGQWRFFRARRMWHGLPYRK